MKNNTFLTIYQITLENEFLAKEVFYLQAATKEQLDAYLRVNDIKPTNIERKQVLSLVLSQK